MSVETTIDFLSAALRAMRLESGRSGKHDLFADRLVKSASEPTLAAAMEHLLRSVDASTDDIHPPLAARMIAVACGPDGPRILRWWREQAKLVTLIAATHDEEIRKAAIAEVTLPAVSGGGRAAPRGEYKIGIRVSCETPLAHGADQKAGNATIFRRMQVLTDSGTLLLPYYAGNAVRGQMRDLLADHFLRSIGLRVDMAQPVISLWFFYLLYSGGALEEKSKAKEVLDFLKKGQVIKSLKTLIDRSPALKKALDEAAAGTETMTELNKELGKAGAMRSAGIRLFRQTLPAMSLLGGALGNRVIGGRAQFADLRPVCYEWGTGERPVAELMTWEYLTRREDHEDHLQHHGMIANTEYLRAGTELEGGIDYDHATHELEKAALGRGLQLLREHGYLGGENRRGAGRVKIELDRCPDPGPYDEYLAENKNEILGYLERAGALDIAQEEAA